MTQLFVDALPLGYSHCYPLLQDSSDTYKVLPLVPYQISILL